MATRLLRKQPISLLYKYHHRRFQFGGTFARPSSAISSLSTQTNVLERDSSVSLSNIDTAMRNNSRQNESRKSLATTTTPSLKRILVASVPCYYWCTSRTAVEGFGWKAGDRSLLYQNALGGVTNPHHATRCVRLFSTTTDESESTNDETFATSYHAPVMVNECLDALLDCERGRIRNPKPKSYKKKKKNKRKPKSDDNDDTDDDNSGSAATDTGSYHPPLIFVDGTLGGGGHSNALLQRLRPGDILFGCDVDPNALKTASERLSEYTNHEGTDRPLFIPVETNFGDLADNLPKVVHPVTNEPILQMDGGSKDGVDGILLDLGVSSHQLDEPERGFSFMRDGPLDMRMGSAMGVDGTNNSGLTAADICNEFDEGELQRIFSVYSDEPRAKTVAKAIVQHRPLQTTADLANAIASVTPQFAKNKRHGRTSTCARVFQSLRIVVNNEDGVLSRVLSEACPSLLRPGGRLVVMSYHSMEDRATKRIMRDGTLNVRKNSRPEKDIYGNEVGPTKPFKPVQKRQKATLEETERNPRARSAVLRVAERQDDA